MMPCYTNFLFERSRRSSGPRDEALTVPRRARRFKAARPMTG
jgi:hypothetical protein